MDTKAQPSHIDTLVGHEEEMYGWAEYDVERGGHVHHVYGSSLQVGMCSPDAFRHKTSIGKGSVVKIKVTIIEEIK